MKKDTVKTIHVEGGPWRIGKRKDSRILGIEDMSRHQGRISILLNGLCKYQAKILRTL